MRNVARRPVAVHHSYRRVADVGELMKYAMRNVDRLSCLQRLPLLTQAHFTSALDEEVNLFLLLVVPGHLPAIWLERDMSHRKTCRLDRARAAHQVLRSA